MKKESSNRAQLFMRNKYTDFTMGGTAALRSVNKHFPKSYSSAANFFGIRTHRSCLRCDTIWFIITDIGQHSF